MQAWSGQPPTGTGMGTLSPARKFLTTVLIVCSLIGLIAGFAIGGLTGRANTTAQTPIVKPTHTVVSTSQNTPSPTATVALNQTIGDPEILSVAYTEKADGATSYILSAKITDNNKQQPHNITATDVLCKLWLTQDATATTATLKANNYALLSHINQLQQPIAGEVVNGLTFATSTASQIQTCGTNGASTTWTYTLSPTVKAGQYYLFVVADWEGKHFNWYDVNITVTGAS